MTYSEHQHPRAHDGKFAEKPKGSVPSAAAASLRAQAEAAAGQPAPDLVQVVATVCGDDATLTGGTDAFEITERVVVAAEHANRIDDAFGIEGEWNGPRPGVLSVRYVDLEEAVDGDFDPANIADKPPLLRIDVAIDFDDLTEGPVQFEHGSFCTGVTSGDHDSYPGLGSNATSDLDQVTVLANVHAASRRTLADGTTSLKATFQELSWATPLEPTGIHPPVEPERKYRHVKVNPTKTQRQYMEAMTTADIVVGTHGVTNEKVVDRLEAEGYVTTHVYEDGPYKGRKKARLTPMGLDALREGLIFVRDDDPRY